MRSRAALSFCAAPTLFVLPPLHLACSLAPLAAKSARAQEPGETSLSWHTAAAVLAAVFGLACFAAALVADPPRLRMRRNRRVRRRQHFAGGLPRPDPNAAVSNSKEMEAIKWRR